MAKILGNKEKILLALAFLGDVFDETRLLGGLVPTAYQNLYGWVPPQYKRSNFYKTISQLVKTGEIKKTVEAGEVFLVLANRGIKTLGRKFPLLKFAKKRWDKIWTMVAFDIKEVERKKRNFLRKNLLTWTFGKMQKSVYITPHPIAEDVAEWLQAHHLEKVARVFRSELVLGDEKKLAEKIWKVSRLNKGYQKLLDQWGRNKNINENGRKKLISKLKNRLLEIMVTDPFLPRELLPSNWVGEEARKIIISLK